MESRKVSDILQELRSQTRNSMCTIKVNRKSFWKSSIHCFCKKRFSPYSTLHVSFKANKQKAGQQADISLSQYFKLLLNEIENSDVFEGCERKNLSLNRNGK